MIINIKCVSLNLYVLLSAGLDIFIYFNKYEIFINEKTIYNRTVEHHSILLLTYQEIVKKKLYFYIFLLFNNLAKNKQFKISGEPIKKKI